MEVPIRLASHIRLNQWDSRLDESPSQQQRLAKDVRAVAVSDFGVFALQGEGIGKPSGIEKIEGPASVHVELADRWIVRRSAAPVVESLQQGAPVPCARA